MKHDNNFDLLRLFAACQVIYMHSAAHLGLPRGGLLFDILSQFPGVPVFFVISGFLVTDSCRRSTLPAYFFKRALRIYPGLFVNIAILEAVVALTGTLAQLSSPVLYPFYFLVYVLTGSDWIASAITTVPLGWVPGFLKWYPSGVLWSLTVELSFYLVLPFFLIRTVGLPLLVLAVGGSLYMASQATSEYYGNHILFALSVVPALWMFAIGIFCQLFWDHIKAAFVGKAGLWLLGFACLVYFANQSGTEEFNYRITPNALTFARTIMMGLTVLSCAFTLPSLSRVLRGQDFSYGMYLYHMLVVVILRAVDVREHWWLWGVVYGCTLCLAALSWFLIEKPALRLKSRSFATRPTALNPTASQAL